MEIIGFWSIFCLLLVGLAEFRPQFRILGILGSLLLIPLAFWINDSGIEIQTGQTTSINTTTNTTSSGTTSTGTQVDTGSKTAFSPPYFPIRNLMFMILAGLAVFGALHYAQMTLPGIAKTKMWG